MGVEPFDRFLQRPASVESTGARGGEGVLFGQSRIFMEDFEFSGEEVEVGGHEKFISLQ